MSRLADDDSFETKCVHVGSDADPSVGAVNTPISLSTTFAQPDVAKPLRFDYSRGGNPTRAALESAIAALEGAKDGFAFASGLSAFDAVLRTCSAGDHVVCAEDAYGGSIRLLSKITNRQGLGVTFVDTRDADAVQSALRPETKWVIMETPTNPLLRVTDIRATAEMAHDAGARMLVDNTFMGPVLQNPLALGADAVFHSATKSLGGHTDVLAGLLATSDAELGEQLRFIQMAVGAVLPPFDCSLLLRGIRTLHLRVPRQSENAHTLAERLHDDDRVRSVHYPGLPDDPGHAIHMEQARAGGSMLSIRVDDGEAARHVVTSTRLWTLAESLGAVESLIQVPRAMTHASVPDDIAARTGLDPGLIRLSVGIEDVADLWEDLDAALG